MSAPCAEWSHAGTRARDADATIWIRAYGTPVPKGQISHSLTGHAYNTNNKRLKPWRAALEKAVINDAPHVTTITEAVVVSCVVFLDRPKKHYRTGKFAHVLRDDAPAYPTAHQLGDIDKHQRAIYDALTDAGLLADDSLVVTAFGYKVWATDDDPAGALIGVDLAGVA